MPTQSTQDDDQHETTTSTKRVFSRADKDDPIEVVDVVNDITESTTPRSFHIVTRQETYFGPKIRVEADDGTQYNLTAPGPTSEAILWERQGFEYVKAAEMVVEFGDDLPQHRICKYCGEPITTAAHETESFLGTCDR